MTTTYPVILEDGLDNWLFEDGREIWWSDAIGSISWGHVTGTLEDNRHTFAGNWTGTAAIVGSGDGEEICLDATEYMVSEIVNTGASMITEILQNIYLSGDSVVLKYRHGVTEASLATGTWNVYSSSFVSLGYVQVRIEPT